MLSIFEAPVVEKPEMLSKTALTMPGAAPVRYSGNAPIRLAASHERATTVNDERMPSRIFLCLPIFRIIAAISRLKIIGIKNDVITKFSPHSMAAIMGMMNVVPTTAMTTETILHIESITDFSPCIKKKRHPGTVSPVRLLHEPLKVKVCAVTVLCVVGLIFTRK